ncbi:MAG: TRAP transporter substrate-binding protein [Pseudomonadota bacterium]
MKTSLSAAALAASLVIGVGVTPANALEERQFNVVGTWGQLAHWREREDAFWNETLPNVSGGKLTANAKPLTELGLDGRKVMRDVRAGAFDFAHGVFLYISGDSPVIEGADLAGMVPDVETFRKVMDAYLPVLNKEFDEKYDAKILMLYAWPRSQMYCNLPEDTGSEISLDALKGLKIRSYGASLADFIGGTLEAQPVPVAFAEVLPSLQRGVIDCGVTGNTSAYDAKWWQVATHEVRIPVGYTASFLAVSNRVWDSLSDEAKALLTEEIGKLEDAMWAATAADDDRGMNCNTDGPCETENGNMKAVSLSADAQAAMKASLEEAVIQAWAERCKARSDTCVEDWNGTIGELLGLTAQ